MSYPQTKPSRPQRKSRRRTRHQLRLKVKVLLRKTRSKWKRRRKRKQRPLLSNKRRLVQRVKMRRKRNRIRKNRKRQRRKRRRISPRMTSRRILLKDLASELSEACLFSYRMSIGVKSALLPKIRHMKSFLFS